MSPGLAESLVNRLVAAFPVPHWADDTVLEYCRAMLPYEYEPASEAVAQFVTEALARPAISTMRNAVAQRQSTGKQLLDDPNDWRRLDDEQPIASYLAGVSHLRHPGQGITPGPVVRTSPGERRDMEAQWKRQVEDARKQRLAKSRQNPDLARALDALMGTIGKHTPETFTIALCCVCTGGWLGW